MTGRSPQRAPELAGFRALELLGSGGFSDVFRYEQLDLGRHVAVKVLLQDLGPQALQHFRTEANLMAKLSNHPSIVSVFSSGVARDGRAYLVMEMCPAAPLSTRIRRRPLSVPKTLEIAIQIAGAVETAHRLGILHRDIKPANILFTDYGRPVLTDFGIAGQTSGRAVDAFSMIWAPPEQVAGEPTGPASDVYSLAATTWAMLTGHSPVEVPGSPNDTWAVTNRVRSVPAPRTGRPDVPESLERVLSTALAKSPNARYASALEYARALQGVQAELRALLTPIDVMADEQEDWDNELADGGTRVTGFAAFDPDDPASGASGAIADQPIPNTVEAEPLQPPSPGWMNERYDPSPVIQHGQGVRQPGLPQQWGGHEAPEARDLELTPPAEQPPMKRRSRLGVLLAAAIVIMVVGAAAAVGTLLTGAFRGTSEGAAATPTARPVDPIGLLVPRPTDVRAVREDGRVKVTWNNPQPADGDYYLHRVPEPGQDPAYEKTIDRNVTLAAPPGRICVEIVLSRRNGRYSEPAVACTES